MRVKDPLLNYTPEGMCIKRGSILCQLQCTCTCSPGHYRIVEMKIMSIKPIVNWPDTCNKHYKIYALKENDLKIYCNIELDQSLHQK